MKSSTKKTTKSQKKKAKKTASTPIQINISSEEIVNASLKRENDFFEAMVDELNNLQKEHKAIQSKYDFCGQMALQSLIQQAENICRINFDMSCGIVYDKCYPTIEDERKKFSSMLAKLETALGKEYFENSWEQARATHNECTRSNLDNSDGHLYCYIIPKMNSDGSFAEPIGEKDVPWNRKE